MGLIPAGMGEAIEAFRQAGVRHLVGHAARSTRGSASPGSPQRSTESTGPSESRDGTRASSAGWPSQCIHIILKRLQFSSFSTAATADDALGSGRLIEERLIIKASAELPCRR
jgi:hypothetical protein